MKFKPCPFCGSVYIEIETEGLCFIKYRDGKNPTGYRVRCYGECGASTTWWHNIKEAKNAWNERINE